MPNGAALFPSPSKNARYFLQGQMNVSLGGSVHEMVISWNTSSLAVSQEVKIYCLFMFIIIYSYIISNSLRTIKKILTTQTIS